MNQLRTFTMSDLIAWEPCARYAEADLERLAAGRRSMNAMEALNLDIPATDRLWVVLRDELLPASVLRECACRFAERVLPIFEGQFPDDSRPREAIETACRFARGDATETELAAAWAAASSASGAASGAARAAARAAMDVASAAFSAASSAATWGAASSAAGAAAWAAASAAAWGAAWGAASSAESNRQTEIVKAVISEHFKETEGEKT